MLEHNICKNCGKEYDFEPKRGTYKFQYCSDKCKHEFAEKDNKPQYRICKNCGKKYWWDGKSENYEGKIIFKTREYCCYECGKEYKYNKIKQTTLDHYGAIGYASAEIQNKIKETNLEQYGDVNYNNRKKIEKTNLEKYGTKIASQSDQIKEKIKEYWNNLSEDQIKERSLKIQQTNLEKYNVINVSQIQEVKEKIANTWNNKTKKEKKEITKKRRNSTLEHYGVTSYAKTTEFKNNIKQIWKNRTDEDIKNINDKREKTCLEKYNVTHFMKSEKFIEEYKQNMIQKFGIEYPYFSEKAQEKKKETCLKKWGTEYSITHPLVREKIKETFIEKYGVDNPFSSEELREKGKKTCLEHYGVEYGCISKPCIEASNDIISKTNLKFYEMLKDFDINAELEFPLEKYSYDIKVNNILIEIDPTFTHNSSDNIKTKNLISFKKAKDYHLNKTLLALKKGYRCIHIFDWDSPYKIVQLLKPKKSIGARILTIKTVKEDETKLFLEQYHLQNSCNNQEIRLGLYKDNELIEIMTFGKPRYNKKYEYELLRLCTKSNYKVIGGTEKLFKYFIVNYKPKSIISYCDNSKFIGEVYKRLGMTLNNYGEPTKHWFNISTNKHITDNLLRQRGYSQLHSDKEHKKGESNEQLMLEAGYLEVYDCGQSTYVWNNYDH